MNRINQTRGDFILSILFIPVKRLCRLAEVGLLTAVLLVAGCAKQPWIEPPPPLPSSVSTAAGTSAPKQPSAPESPAPLARMGYAVQVGAFARLDYAVRLERQLAARGLDAYYFRHASGLYKVRFGNHPCYEEARQAAEKLRAQGAIDEFFIVRPEELAAARAGRGEGEELRAELVRTARRFLGTPYRWGGADREEGFDCSGLTMVCYRLNGIDLPRESRYQFQAGRQVEQGELRRGDLVFFATRGGRRVSHVGLYIGDGRFIHAPRTGEEVRIEALSHPFYERTFLGGRSYL